METFFYLIFIVLGLFLLRTMWEIFKQSKMSPEEKTAYREEAQSKYDQLKQNQMQGKMETFDRKRGTDDGIINPALVCPHCQEKGHVKTKIVKMKKGISGAKATGAILTGGISLLATGLSRKEGITQAHCTNCGSTWQF